MATLKQDAMVVAGIGLGVVLIAWYLKSKVSEAVDAVPEALADVWDASVNASKYVNPVSNDNVFYRAQTGMYQWMTGSQGSVGTDLYDATHGGRLDPTSSNNAAAASVDWLGEKITGQKDWNLGTAIYDWLH